LQKIKNQNPMIVITGALGFIGSSLITYLNEKGHNTDIFVVDDFYKDHKEINLDKKFIREWVHRDIFLETFANIASQISFVFHLGARTDTTSKDKATFDKLNLQYSKDIWNICAQNNVPLIYASSAATYGDGSNGYSDDHKGLAKLEPLNAYAKSKHQFDLWALKQKTAPPFWVGLKFFNVYGPNEYHKKRMASVVFHTAEQIKNSGEMKLFKSHKKGIANGEQARDFIYVKDIVKVLFHFFRNTKKASGIYNVGTGKARTFNDLANNTFRALGLEAEISYIDTPQDIRKNYQYFTEADITKLRKVGGYRSKFYSLEDGVGDYVKKYLVGKKIY
ncbi:MAG: ADP-L-glycero-D-manno-heptose 6-epimerase, partial [Nonlabens sp.]